MNFVRVSVPLLVAERNALRELADFEDRGLEAQAAWIIKRELERRGLLESKQRYSEPASSGGNLERSA